MIVVVIGVPVGGSAKQKPVKIARLHVQEGTSQVWFNLEGYHVTEVYVDATDDPNDNVVALRRVEDA